MRVDKFLWSIRIYKTRSIAVEEIKRNRVSIGDIVVKPSREVKLGDCIKVKKNAIELVFRVINLPKGRLSAKLVAEYVQDLTDSKEYEKLKLRNAAQDYYRRKGEGRPTKKDRRDIDDFVHQPDYDWDLLWEDDNYDD